jgi:polyisoprenoid-binding protein YceI
MTSTTTAPALTGAYEIDAANSRIGFAARYAMVSTVRGRFDRFDAAIHIDAAEPERSSAQVCLFAASIGTGQRQRDEHLRSPDFLDVDTYPEIRFDSTAVRPLDGDRYELAGELTICTTTQPVAIEFTVTGTSTDHRGIDLIGFAGSAMISRAAFGMRWNAILETGGVLVADEVALEFDLALMRRQACPAPAPRRKWRSALRPGHRR